MLVSGACDRWDMHLPAGPASESPLPCFHHANVSPRGYVGLERASVKGGVVGTGR